MITTYMAVLHLAKLRRRKSAIYHESEDNTQDDTTQPKPDDNSDKPQSGNRYPKIESNAYKIAQMLSNGDYAYTLSGCEKLEKHANDHGITLDESWEAPFAYGVKLDT